MTAAWVLHIDLDQFLAAVEVLRHPELKGLPVVIGGDGDPTKRGVVSTASYEARELGVHSGQPLRTAAKRAPDAIFLPVDKDTYEEVSERVMATLRTIEGSVVEVLGWDEAFMGITTDDPEAVAREIARRVKERTELDCSVGIGQNKLQAKIATGFGKPAGVYRITNDTWYPLLGDRPTEALWGIGSKTAKKLANLGFHTVRELAAADPKVVAAELGPTTGPFMVLLARGRGSAEVTDSPWIARSRSRETTYQNNLTEWSEVRAEILRLAALVSEDVRAEQRPAVRVVVKIRYAPFITKTHGEALDEPTAEPATIAAAALTALDWFTERRPVRLLGVRAEFPEVEEDR
ncbi:DNA polymerase IV [Allorhizocola rhizosphaerae]|uniref:DNA polymerase IV n=1 Tax=Allorhizocola rhizosphaerae TaxID=1872709 RepID=UPI000E3CE3FD|nr:DNA polymerase IV [Allorhizocola rhizosphaerae]